MKVFSVDFHWKKNLIFYAAKDKIYKENYTSQFHNGTGEIVEDKDVDGPVSIAVDWVHDKLYWLSIRHNIVGCSSLNGTERTVLIDTLVNTLYPNNIAVDPYEGYIFFVSNHTILKATLDGKHLAKVQLNGSEGRAVKHVAVDSSRKRLFYTGKDGNFNTGPPYMASCDYEGQNVEEIHLSYKWNDIYSLSIFRKTLYFTHYPKSGVDTVWKVDLTDKQQDLNVVYLTSEQKGGLWSIKVFHPEVQEKPLNME